MAKEKKYQVTAISDALTDIIIELDDDSIKKLGLKKGQSIVIDDAMIEKFRSVLDKDKMVISPGGSPTNVIYGASNLGLKCAFLGCVGNDDYGYDYINNLRENNIDTYISIKQGDSGRCFTFIGTDGERSFGLDFGITKQLYPYEILHSLIRDSEYLHFSAYEFRGNNPINEATRYAIEQARKYGTKISFDLGDSGVILEAKDQLKEKLFDKKIDILFANENEAEALCGNRKFEDLLKYSELVVVKLGSEGSIAYTPEGSVHVDAYKVDHVKDTNGAGDNFQAGFFYGLHKKLPLRTCLKIGNFLASNIIKRIGAQSQVKIEGIEYII
jgi:sugar/nucleoside kinase (ribokinase family)